VGSSISLSVILVLLVAALVWLIARPRRSGGAPRPEHPDIDQDVLDEAEQEVQELDALTRPEDADDQLPDWGPGAPKP
jgi:hypothetical protein